MDEREEEEIVGECPFKKRKIHDDEDQANFVAMPNGNEVVMNSDETKLDSSNENGEEENDAANAESNENGEESQLQQQSEGGEPQTEENAEEGMK
jgi:hypothetical protein